MTEVPQSEKENLTTDLKDDKSLELKAEAVIHKNILWSMGAGLIPFPVFDVFALTGIQLKMIHEISKLYKVPFNKNKGKALITSLLGGFTAGNLAIGSMSLLKSIPVIGTTAGGASMSILGGATTYAVGKVFLRHFQSGGTLLDFDSVKSKEFFIDMLEKGKEIAAWEKKKKEKKE